MRVYISGAITGVANYKEVFKKAKEELEAKGHEVINPAAMDEILPQLTWEEYMVIDIALLSVCEAIYMLKGWENSRGANQEYIYAYTKGMKIMVEGE